MEFGEECTLEGFGLSVHDLVKLMGNDPSQWVWSKNEWVIPEHSLYA